jgi:hypothetical protein
MRNHLIAISCAIPVLATAMAAQICSPSMIQMAAASQPKDTVIKMIKKSNCDLSVADVVALGKAGVSEDIIEAAAPSMQKSAPTGGSTPGAKAAVESQLTPESTIDVEAYANGKRVASLRPEMVQQPPPSESQMLFTKPHLTGRHTPRHDIVLDGTETKGTVPADPNLLFVYANADNSLTKAKLVHMKSRKDDRLLYTAELVSNKDPKGDFVAIEIKDGESRSVVITPREPLTPGESYALIAEGNIKAWAFRVEKTGGR